MIIDKEFFMKRFDTADEAEVKSSLLREQIEEQYKWRVDKLYANEDDWELDFAAAQIYLSQGASFQGHLGEGWEVVRDFLVWDEEFSRLLDKLYLYAAMRRDEDNTNGKYQALYDRVQGLAISASQATAFFSPEILALPEEQLGEYLAQPDMALYKRMFEDITRMREHTLSPAEEVLLAGSGEMAGAFRNIYSMLTNADLPFPTITNEDGEQERLSAANYIRFLKSKNRQVRKAAFEAKYDAYAAYGNTISSVYSSSVKKDNFYAAASHFDSALASSLFADNVEESVYHNLIATVRENLGVFHSYLEKRRQLLGVDELHMYDVYVPLYPDLKQDFSWEKAKSIVLSGLGALGEDYLHTLSEGLNNGWVDVYENKGKTSGAYSTGIYESDPYILMNYQNDLNSVFTLAHEAGHSMHSYYSRRVQPYIYSDYRIFVAEVASTVNENLLISHLRRQATSEAELNYLNNHYLEEFRGTVIRQTMFAEFELLVHQAAAEGKPLTSERLCEIYYQLNKDYFGQGMVIDDRIAWEWARIPHFYRPFYVYKYATGFSAASALAMGLENTDESARKEAQQRYLQFLSAGSSKDPLDLLADAGVDMRRPEPIKQAFELFKVGVEALS